MNWQYYIPHKWESRERAAWEDVYLRPLPGQVGMGTFNHKKSLWLTIEALGSPMEPVDEYSIEENRERLERQEAFRGREYYSDPRDETNLWINQDVFTRKELLKWVKIWIIDNLDDDDPKLKKGSAKDFAGTNQHSCSVAKAKKIAKLVKSAKVKE